MWPSLTCTSINRKFDTLLEHLTCICNEALPITKYKELDNNPNQWKDYYISILLHMYITLIGEDTINCKFLEQSLPEPIILYKRKKNQSINLANKHAAASYDIMVGDEDYGDDDDNDEFDPTIIEHVLSINYIKNLFAVKFPFEYEVYAAKRKLEEVKLPSIFKIDNILPDYNEHSISIALTNKLLMLYVIANHAAYHYTQLKESKSADYAHNQIEKTSQTSTGVFYLHNLFTRKPDDKISQYVSDRLTYCGDGDTSKDLEEMFVYSKNKKPGENHNYENSDSACSNISTDSSDE